MNLAELVRTWALTFVAILAINIVIRAVVKGPEALLAFSWLGVAIAAAIAVLVTLGAADRGTKRADDQP